MIRALILYFLNVRPTHGYDVQRFVEINGVDKWSKIQSGSIYYALNKLEKEGCIYTLREERTGARVRKIYDITDKGRNELKKVLKEELMKPIYGVESDKFMIHLMFNKLSKEEIEDIVEKHISDLKDKKHWWEMGKKLKITSTSLKLDAITFDMAILSLDNQIKWHEVLLEELDEIIKYSAGVEKIVSSLDFANLGDDLEYNTCGKQNLGKIEDLKNEIVKNPENLEEKITQLIHLLRKN